MSKISIMIFSGTAQKEFALNDTACTTYLWKIPGEGHVVQVKECGSVGEHGVDVDLLDVGDVAHRVTRHVQVTHVLQNIFEMR